MIKMMLLHASPSILIALGLISLFVGLIKVRTLLKIVNIQRGLWQALFWLIVFFILGYAIYLASELFTPLSPIKFLISTVFCFGGIFVALITSLSKTTVYTTQLLESIRTQNRELRFKAEHDDLTGLYKKNFFNESINYACRIAKYSDDTFCLLYIDFDKFKKINDTYGHLGGDAVLKEISTLFEKHFRKTDVVARIGGDEFAVLLNNLDYKTAKKMADDLNSKVLEMKIPFKNSVICPSISVGISVINKNNCDPEAVVTQADEATYAAKAKK